MTEVRGEGHHRDMKQRFQGQKSTICLTLTAKVRDIFLKMRHNLSAAERVFQLLKEAGMDGHSNQREQNMKSVLRNS